MEHPFALQIVNILTESPKCVMPKLWFTKPLKKGEHYLSFMDEFVLDSIVSFYTFVLLLPICLLILSGRSACIIIH